MVLNLVESQLIKKETKIKKKSLTAVIFISTLLVGGVVYFLCSTIFIMNLNKYYEGQIYKELQIQSQFISKLLEVSDIKSIQEIQTNNRITLINKDGSVYFDNEAPVNSLENHNSRKEIIQARSNGTGQVERFSNTMLEKTLYFALLQEDGTIVRISSEQHSVGAVIIGLTPSLTFLFILAVIVSIIIASLISKKVTKELNKINLDNPETSNVFQEIKPFTKKLAEENIEKAQQEALRQQFTANVSHELKTPLTSISGFAEILKNCVKDDIVDKKTIIDFSSSIYDECQRMITLVSDIIKLSKLDEKSIFQEKEELSLMEIATNVVKSVKGIADKRNIKIDLSGDSGNIVGVYSVIYEMIFNLCDNAIKYNKDNGKVTIKIKTNKDTKKVDFSVEDTGIGFSGQDKERIFERFYRIDKSRSKASGGTGLGLSIVKHGAKYHNADVYVESEPNVGSKFIISF